MKYTMRQASLPTEKMGALVFGTGRDTHLHKYIWNLSVSFRLSFKRNQKVDHGGVGGADGASGCGEKIELSKIST